MEGRPHLRYIDGGPMAPTVSIAAATAPGKALGSFGDALAGLGEKGFQIAEQIRETEERGKISAWRANASHQANEFSNSLLTRNDTDNWPDEWKTLSEEIGAKIDGLGLSPVAKERAKLEHSEWSASEGDRLSTQAAMRKVAEGKAQIAGTWRYFAERGDEDGLKRTREDAAALGLPPHELEEMDREAARIENKAKFARDLEDRPAAVLEQTKSDKFLEENPGLTEFDQETLKREAENRVGDQREKENDRLSAKFKDGTLRQSDIDFAPHLTAEDRKAFTDHMKKNVPPTRKQLATQWDRLDVLRQARSDAGMTSEQYRALYYETKAGVLNSISPAYQGEMEKELNYLSPAGRKKMLDAGTAAPSTKEDKVATGRAIISRALDRKVFGDIDEGSNEEQEAAYRRAEDLNAELKQFVADKPDATVTEIRAHADALISGPRTTAAKDDLKSMVPGSGGSLRGKVFAPTTPAQKPWVKRDTSGGVLPQKEEPAWGDGTGGDELPPIEDLENFLNDGN